MGIRLRTTARDEIELISALRIDFILDIHPDLSREKINSLKANTIQYFNDLIKKGLYTGFIGEINGKSACCAGLLKYYLPPLEETPRQVGHILNFFTYPDQRNKGYGNRMMEFIISHARESGFNRLFLNATGMGEPLYRKHGFSEQKDCALILDL